MRKSNPTSKQKKKQEGPVKEDPAKINVVEIEKTEHDSSAWGGLPARDLKKNLGCG